MEVHHSNLGNSKHWKHYLREFFMLFLAVFCGSLAEYQLEHKIERDRAHELAQNFYEELKNDSVTIALKSKNRLRQEASLRYMKNYILDSNLTDLPKSFAINFEYGITFRSPGFFSPRTIILDQLQNSGSLRYFRNEQLQELIGDLTVAILNIRDRQALETTVRMEFLNPVLVNHHDFNFWEQVTEYGSIPFDQAISDYESSDKVIPFQIKNIEKIDRLYLSNTISYYLYNLLSSTRTVHFKKYIDINAELLKELREEYELE